MELGAIAVSHAGITITDSKGKVNMFETKAILGAGGIEEWRDVVGYEGFYQVSSLGRVRGVRRYRTLGRILKPATYDGYLRVGLCVNGVLKSFAVHRLVTRAFIGERPKGDFQTDHKNQVRTDNRADNLQYLSRVENNAKRDRTNMFRYAQDGTAAKLTNKQALYIREQRRQGLTIRSLAELNGVAQSTIKRLLYGVTWRTVTNGEPIKTRGAR